MTSKQPKTKLQDFSEKLNKAKSKEEITKIIKQLKTYVSLHYSEEGAILLSYAYYMIGNMEEALKWVEPVKSVQAKMLEISIRISAGEFKKAYNLIKQLESLKLSENMKQRLMMQKLVVFLYTGHYKEAEKLFSKSLKDVLLEGNPSMFSHIFREMEAYKKASELIQKNKELKQAYEKLKEIVKNKIKDAFFVPKLELDAEYPKEELWIDIYIPENIEREEVEKLEDEIINDIFLKYDVDFNYLFRRPKIKGERLVLS